MTLKKQTTHATCTKGKRLAETMAPQDMGTSQSLAAVLTNYVGTNPSLHQLAHVIIPHRRDPIHHAQQ